MIVQALGALALSRAAGGPSVSLFQPAVKVDTVVDSVGAGDTFIAASVAALARGACHGHALRCAVSVAGQKVRQEGFGGLREIFSSAWDGDGISHSPTHD